MASPQISTPAGGSTPSERFLTAAGPTVLQVLPALHTGGVERGTCDMAAAIMEAGWRAVVASSGGPMMRELERAGALHVTLPLDSKNPLTLRTNAGKLVELIARWKIDLVHARSRAPAWSAFWATERSGVPLITTFHGTYNVQNAFKRQYNAVMTKGRRVIAISDFISEHMLAEYGADMDRVRVIPRGVDIRSFDPDAVKAERVIKRELAQAGMLTFHTEARVKGVYSLFRKLERKDWDITKIHDILALRLLVPSVADCYTVLGIVHSQWRPVPGKIKDFIAFPKPNGYQSIHTTIYTGDGGTLEIQVRTDTMNREAKFGIASHFSYKEETGYDSVRQGSGLAWVRQFIPKGKKPAQPVKNSRLTKCIFKISVCALKNPID